MKKSFTILTLLFLIGITSAQTNDTIFIDKDSNGGNGRTWATAFPDFATAVQNLNMYSNVVIFVKYGVYEEAVNLFTWQDSLSSLTIYGGCYGFETAPEHRMLNLGSDKRTVIDASNFDDFAVHISTSSKLKTPLLIDNITIHGGYIGEGSAIEIIGQGEVTFSRCRIENTYSPGNLIFAEGIDSIDTCVTFINCIISDNEADRSIFEAYKSFRIINTTIANNYSPQLFEEGLNAGNNNMFLEIKNSIIYNTTTYSDANYPVNISHSAVDYIDNLVDIGNNVFVSDPQFTNNVDNPYQCVPGSSVEGIGDISAINAYNLFCRNQDIIGQNRTVFGVKLDAGAYQSQTPPIMPSSKSNSNTQKQLSTNSDISIYPTILTPEEYLYFEKKNNESYTVKILGVNGLELIHRQISLQIENISLYDFIPGIYIVIVYDMSGKVIRQEKIIIQ